VVRIPLTSEEVSPQVTIVSLFIEWRYSPLETLMPQMTPIVLTDNQANDHSFAPRGKDPQSGVATLVKSTGVPVGDERLTIGRTRTPQGREKVSFKLTLPVVASETINGVARPTILRTAYADVTLSFEGTSTEQERANARTMLADLLNNSESVASAVIDDLDYLY
jgi:hypothetical protein